MTNIFTNPFVLRQTAESSFSHREGTWEELCSLVKANFANAQAGYREGVIEVTIPSAGVYTGLVILGEGDELTGSFRARRAGEEPRKEIRVTGAQKAAAVTASVILYSSAVLAEGGDNSQEPVDGNWEIVSLNASPIEGEMPIDPMVLMHNHFGSDGGTETGMSDSEFIALLRQGFDFWKNKALAS